MSPGVAGHDLLVAGQPGVGEPHGDRRWCSRSLLVGGEVTTAVLLLFGAGLLLRTLIAVERTDRYRGHQRPLDAGRPSGIELSDR